MPKTYRLDISFIIDIIMKTKFILLIILFLFLEQVISAQEAIVGIEKSVRIAGNESFGAKVVDVKVNSQLDFQLIITNFSTEAIPSLRVIDVFPTGLAFKKGDITPEKVEVINNNTNLLWILRAMQPQETRIINYSTSLLIDGKKDSTCFYNVSSLISNGKLADTSSTEICPLGVYPQILGTMTTQPSTAIFDWDMVKYALIAFGIGTFGFVITNILNHKRTILAE